MNLNLVLARLIAAFFWTISGFVGLLAAAHPAFSLRLAFGSIDFALSAIIVLMLARK